MIDEDGEVVLMDLGVMRIIDEPSASDVEKKQFLGTLIYAPPEYLTRKESGTKEGWRAINYYQIGAVMHDMIMKKVIFSGVEPYANIVIAVKEDAPDVSSSDYPFETIQLTRDLLTKDPEKRLRLIPVNRIASWIIQPDEFPNNLLSQMEEILRLSSGPKAKLQEIENIARSTKERMQIRKDISKKLEDLVSGAFSRLKEMGGPEWSAYDNFSFSTDDHLRQEWEVRNVLITINGTLETGYAQPVLILVRIQSNEHSEATISLLGILLTAIFRKTDQTTPFDIFRQIVSENPPMGSSVGNVIVRNNQPVHFTGPYYTLFEGVVGIDSQLEDRLISAFIKIIKKAILLMTKEVEFQLAQREKRARGEYLGFTRSISSKSILIHDLDNLD